MYIMKCDRCGQVYEESCRVIDKIETNKVQIGKFAHEPGRGIFEKQKRYDLCNDCLEELEDWLKLDNNNREFLK